uniref:Peptidyl-prolyl cis-trans isomerase n=1 Tax=Acanthochromis polyacanthus TaxID=80966 RepID=A0A3Q1FQB8_9TELE
MNSKIHLEIVGLIKDSNFHVAKSIAKGLKQQFPEAFLEPKIQPLLEFDWHAYLCNKKRELRGEVWQYSSGLMCFLNGFLLGNENELASWAQKQWSFTFTRPQSFYMALTEDFYTKHLQKTGARNLMIFDIFISVAILIFYLDFADISPGSRGDGGESIYGPTFEDESFAVSHSKRGILGMASKGPHSNGSQFYITLQPTPWMDKTYVAFGQVVEGVDVLRRLEEAKTYNRRPKYECKVTACGVFKQ